MYHHAILSSSWLSYFLFLSISHSSSFKVCVSKSFPLCLIFLHKLCDPFQHCPSFRQHSLHLLSFHLLNFSHKHLAFFLLSIPEAYSRHNCSIQEAYLRPTWSILEVFLKHAWSILVFLTEAFLKEPWVMLESSLNYTSIRPEAREQTLQGPKLKYPTTSSFSFPICKNKT